MTLNNRTFTLLKIVLLIIISIFIAEIIVLPKIEHDKDYNEIFGILDEYETTIHFIKDLDGKISIGVSIYGPTRRGRTRNRVRLILKEIRELFKNYL